MTVAFEFEDKKEDDENAGKVKVNLLIVVSYFCLFNVLIQIDFETNGVTPARWSDTSLSLRVVPFVIAEW